MTTKNYFIYFFVLFVSTTGLQCKNTHNATSQKAMYRSIYIDQFKLTYFRQLLIKGCNNSKAVQEIIHLDKSGFTEPILTLDDHKLIDSLTTVDNMKMQLDSTSSISRVAEGAAGKHILGFILEKLNGKWLDSLATKRHKSAGVEGMYYK